MSNAIRWITICPDPTAWASRIDAGVITAPDGCWNWTGTFDRAGYGRFRWKTSAGEHRMTGAHRAAWLALRGEIPKSLVIDHLCRNRRCCNPSHMELVTVRTNARRSPLVGRATKPKEITGCGKHGKSNGYVMTMRNGYSRWVCRTCVVDRRARLNASKIGE